MPAEVAMGHLRRDNQRRKQAESRAHATHRFDRWTAEDDAVLRSSLTLEAMAERTGRTYHAVAMRRRALHLGDPNPHAQREDRRPVLCPCASLDGEHEGWCPDAP